MSVLKNVCRRRFNSSIRGRRTGANLLLECSGRLGCGLRQTGRLEWPRSFLLDLSRIIALPSAVVLPNGVTGTEVMASSRRGYAFSRIASRQLSPNSANSRLPSPFKRKSTMKSRILLISAPQVFSHSSSMTIAASLVRAETKETSPFIEGHMNIGTPASTPVSASPVCPFRRQRGERCEQRLLRHGSRRHSMSRTRAAARS